MVVGVTLATIALLRNRGGGSASFISPENLRKAIEKKVADPERAQRALSAVDAMVDLGQRYDDAVLEAMGDYLDLVADGGVGAEQIRVEALDPLEDTRRSILMAFVDLREQLRDAMTEKEWVKVLGKAAQD